MNSTNGAFAPYTQPHPEPSPNGNHSTGPRQSVVRRRLPDERASQTHRFNIGGHKGYVTVGMFPEGGVGELFIVMAKEGSTVSGLVNSFAQVVSVALQYGVPLEVFCEKFTGIRFEPSGFTGNGEIPIATSIMDYIFRWLRLRFVEARRSTAVIQPATAPPTGPVHLNTEEVQISDGPACRSCGSLTRRNGSCFACTNCGATTGCG